MPPCPERPRSWARRDDGLAVANRGWPPGLERPPAGERHDDRPTATGARRTALRDGHANRDPA
eukprot:4840684-Alexandrium_andersonii.AAC.1